MNSFSPENSLVIAACSVSHDIGLLQQHITTIDNWEKACTKLIKKGVAPLFLELLQQHPELMGDPTINHLTSDTRPTPVTQTHEKDAEIHPTKRTKGVPPGVIAQLQQTYLKTMTRSMLLYDAFREIAIKFNDKDIRAVALKGIYLAEHLYPKIGVRQFSDIDLLVNPDDVKTVLEIMEGLGFRMTEPAFGEAVSEVFESAHLRPLVRKGVSVEVHTRLHGPTQSYRLNEREMAQRAVATTINGQPFRVFELHDLLIHLCLHLDKHFNGSHMQLYSWADIAYLLFQRGNEIDFDLLWNRCRDYNAEKEVRKILELTHAVFGAPLPDAENWKMTASIEQLTRHLDDRVSHESGTQTHLFFIRKIKSPLGKLNYLREVLLPGKKLMLRSYNIRNERFYWLWYPYRMWVGIKGFFWKNK